MMMMMKCEFHWWRKLEYPVLYRGTVHTFTYKPIHIHGNRSTRTQATRPGQLAPRTQDNSHPTMSQLAPDSMLRVGLVWFRGLTPQQQPGSYQGGEMMMKSVFLVEETGAPGGNHRPTASN